MSDTREEPSEPLFRASKRRKLVRRRVNEDEDEADHSAPGASPHTDDQQGAPPPHSTIEDSEAPEDSISIAEILRRRKGGRSKRTGIEFTSHVSTSTPSSGLAPDSPPLANDTAQAILDAATSRFAPQTGKVEDELDKHMTAYIDSKMASLTEKPTTTTHPHPLSPPQATTTFATHPATSKHPQPAGQGKLQEVDLGPSSTERNIQLTSAAIARTQNPQSMLPVQPTQSKPRPGLGPDGKPWRPRKRRPSADLRRDALVEAIMSESKIAKYEEAVQTAAVVGDEDLAADERVAEAFKREFMDAVQNRQRKMAPPPAHPVGRGKKGEEEKKGPKLGGSRSARARMAEREKEEKGRK